MLEYVKIILQKVSFDQALFEKELKKALNSLKEEDSYSFQTWCYTNFGNKHKIVLDKCFTSIQI